MTSPVLLEKQGHIGIITLNRPDAMNALSSALRNALANAINDCQQDKDIHVLIVTGNGKAFCAGFDLKELAAGGGDNASAAETADNIIGRAMAAFEGPIIGAINGFAITGGFELALACDVLIASSAAKFADTHARVGILPGWGLSQKLPRLIGMSRAKEMHFTGNTIDAGQACDWGLVNCVVAPDQLLSTAIQMATDMCGCVLPVLRQYKRLIDDGYSMPYDEALAWEEQQGIESAKRASAAMIAQRKGKVIERGREQGRTK
ncbi:MAG: enoyl-CoA hydratase [Pseudomonadales bacterium]|jgi:enoyl-CoA hydratase|nr:enoyl-CoA hydratase [Gammaproteobacteria bacterium]MBK6583231.1 enoyl-CoA hydratase [Gammaproteobacteria bacterium]MBK9666249.1 enoyl-CoA hydratase [Gammaproteobacteria bacterium]MBP6053578.1 enoyl-CoA hydratase [Pseudomonadales bacterium]